jgi:hypothetical protein
VVDLLGERWPHAPILARHGRTDLNVLQHQLLRVGTREGDESELTTSAIASSE